MGSLNPFVGGLMMGAAFALLYFELGGRNAGTKTRPPTGKFDGNYFSRSLSGQ
jgi:hypothetical protein